MVYGLFAATLGLTAWTAMHEESVATSTASLGAINPTKTSPLHESKQASVQVYQDKPTSLGIFRQPWGDTAINLFAVNTPVESTLDVSQSKPETSFPFQYVGKMIDQTGTRIFLADGERNFVVSEKTVLDGTWKISQIKFPIMTVRHLPTKTNMTFKLEEQH